MTLLNDLWLAGQLRTLDHALAQSLRRLDRDTPDAVLAAAALASLAVSKGHAGVWLADPQPLLDGDAVIAWPPADAWQAQLAASRWVATPDHAGDSADPHAPLVLEGGLLYLRRYREYERALAQGLQRIAAQPVPATGIEALALLFATLFPHATHDDHQARAAALALRHALLLVTGGPGTGKTTTTARLLVLLAAQAQQAGIPPPRIALAAPTGRAAERMAESVRHAVQALAASGIPADLLASLPTTGTTLHRLLGTVPDSPRFRHHADNPLPFDVVVVDEASMIDLPLMAKLVDAVADGTRLVLLGDPDQLPSVEAGDVLAAILAAAGEGDRLASDDAAALFPLLGDLPDRHPGERECPAPLPTEIAAPQVHDTPAFAGVRVHLQRGWRQSEALQLAPLAAAVREGDADTALSLLRGGSLSNVHFHENLADPLQAQGETLLAHWRALGHASSPAEALALSTRLRILTAVREGPQGARTLNARIERLLADSGATGPQRAGPGHFHGQLIIVTENSYRHRLFNGDIGLCLRDGQGALVAWFPGDDPAQPRAFHPAALPAHESAFAMTVHKAQGSEFDTVWLLLPARGNRVLSRELVYTGITRARRELHVAGSEAVIREALARHASRWSGLGWRLGSRHARR
ncbi:exodeoxyribonuclease V subunit alpha [Pseudoxanthomonas sp. SL93]|uniref:exodeoxyribonuclease V subunit alpha n=1 Tax=Pseudoxanthomonas sp. SL93 TaxID=2995142 RepID=UPI0022700AB1|nr:exodeoxyribonuclease V subunit alpha [Pseudoxanthomonas sp. SL93]WAC64986.1 exodeoxyribonuclease V subunit alpha [Pseudoxanthomonas sp. SL93]